MKQSEIRKILDEKFKDYQDIDSIPKGDWLALIRHFQYSRTKKNGDLLLPYVSELRMSKLLRRLSCDCWPYAIDCIMFAIDNRYEGFSNGAEMYFKGDVSTYKAKEKLKG